MKSVFIDTSAIFALLVANDINHPAALRIWDHVVVTTGCRIFTSNYVIAETYDLVRRRLGLEALTVTDAYVRENVELAFIAEAQHERARMMLLRRARRDLSLVDCASFVVARDEAADACFAFDRHFEEEDFVLLRA